MDDLLQLNNFFSTDENMVRDSVRHFVDAQVLPQIAAAYEEAVFPAAWPAQLAELGVLGMTLPTEYGGLGASPMSYGLACQELERGDSGLRSFVSVQSSLCMYPIFRYGTEEQKKTYLPKMARAELIGCFGLTEADAGSDPSSMKTQAKKVEGGWLLNGSKLWITNAPIADLAIIWAKTEAGIRGFIVTKETPGFVRNTLHHKGSLRASHTGELVFQNCFIPDSHYLPGSEKGLAAPLSCLSQARYGIAWGVIGAAIFCYETALDYAKGRKQFNKPLAQFQLIQHQLVEMYNEIVKAQLMNIRMAQLKQQEECSPVLISLSKMNHCRQALHIAREARNVLGANGISLEYHVIRHLENLESVFTYEGTDHIHHLIVGRYLTGLDAFS